MSLTNSTLRAAGGGSLEVSTRSAIDEAADNPRATSPKPNRRWSPGLNFLLKKQGMLYQYLSKSSRPPPIFCNISALRRHKQATDLMMQTG